MSKPVEINWDNVKRNSPLFDCFLDCLENVRDLRIEDGQDWESQDAQNEMEEIARCEAAIEAQARGIRITECVND